MDFCCEYCGFTGSPTRSPVDVDAGPKCPVCHDGQADPWEIIREIRAVLRLQGPAAAAEHLEPAAAPDRFETEWPLLEVSIQAIWSDITAEELASVRRDRIALEGLLRRKYGYGIELASQLCTGVEELHERFNGQWEVVRECVPQYWADITDRDVSNMTGTMSELSGLLSRRYGLSGEAARSELASFLEKIDYPTLVRVFGATEHGVGDGEEMDPYPGRREFAAS